MQETTSLELFAGDTEVRVLSARLPTLAGAARLEGLVALAWHLRQRHTIRALRLVDEAMLLLRATAERAQQSIVARLLLIRAEASALDGEFERADAQVRTVLRLLDDVDDAIGCADAHWLLAQIANDRGNMAHCETELNAVCTVRRDQYGEVRAALAEIGLANIAIMREPSAAISLLPRIAALSNSETPALQCWANAFRSMQAFGAGDYSRVVLFGALAQCSALSTGQIRNAITAATHVGVALARMDDHDGALEWLWRAGDLAKSTGWMLSERSRKGATDLANESAFRETREHESIIKTLCVVAPFTDAFTYSSVLQYNADLDLARGAAGAALTSFSALAQRAQRLSQATVRIDACLGQAAALDQLDQPAQAVQMAQQALTLADQVQDSRRQTAALAMRVELLRRTGFQQEDAGWDARQTDSLRHERERAARVDEFAQDEAIDPATAMARSTEILQQWAAEGISWRWTTTPCALTGELQDSVATPQQRNSVGRPIPEAGRFLAQASHELRQPMHALNLYLGALETFELPPEARPVLTHARQCAGLADQLFLALLDLARLDAEVVQPDITPVAMAVVLTRIAAEFAPLARAKGVDFHLVASNAWVESDTTLLLQMLRSFTANAVRFTDSGKIVIGCRRIRGRLRVEVHDTGIGIPSSQHRAVFDEFSRINAATRAGSGGVGLSLAIARRVGRLLSIPITLRSSPGRGAMFAIELPLLANHVDLPKPVAPVAAVAASLAGKLIVVIDDEERILDAMQVLLTQWGCLVIAATSGSDAISKLSSIARLPDALVCDYRLGPSETGLDVIHTLHDEFNHAIPALLITGDTAVEFSREMLSSGFPVLHKPVPAALLHASLCQLLG